MSLRPGGPAAVWLRIAGVVAVLLIVFALAEGRVRVVETWVYAELLRVVGFHGVALVSGSSVYLEPVHGPPFWVTVTASCSSLAPVLTLACLAMLLPKPPGGRARLAMAYGAAALAVFIGNLLRIDASMAAGLRYGQSVLVLFHDSAGTIFAFAYTLGGFVLMLWLQLPDRSREVAAADPVARAATPAIGGA